MHELTEGKQNRTRSFKTYSYANSQLVTAIAPEAETTAVVSTSERPKGNGEEEEGKGEREIGSEALAKTEKNRKCASRDSNQGPQQTRLMLYH